MAVAAGDWRDAASYARLLPGDRRCFAWEWLRRTPTYRDACLTKASPALFGLLRWEDPACDALTARPIWAAAVDRAVLQATTGGNDRADQLDLRTLAHVASVVPSDALTGILFSDGLRSIRVDIHASLPPETPLTLTWHLEGVITIGPQLAALGQLASLVRRGRFAMSLHPPERRARRWIAMLRVHDALASGATARDIVHELFDVRTAEPRWRVASGSWRLRAQRLAAGARACLAMGPALWLDGGFEG